MTAECQRSNTPPERLDDFRLLQSKRWWHRLQPVQAEHRNTRVLAHAALCAAGSAALTLLSFACFLLGFNFATTAFALLIVIVLLSLLDSLVSSVIFSAVAVGGLAFLFIDPIYSFAVGGLEDIVTLATFLITSLTIVGLVRRLHSLEREQLAAAARDITAQKKAHAELERSELRYRQLFSRMPIALRQLDASRLVVLFRKLRAEGVEDLGSYFDSHPDFLQTCMEALTFQEANERAVQMFGGGYAGRSMADTWRERPDTFRRAMESRFRGETNFEEETRMVTWDDRVVDVLFTTARVGPINDLELSLVGTIDISQRVRAQERLQQVQAEFAHAARVSVLGELTASIAHEVNQPLAAIATNAAAGLRWLNRPNPDLAEVRSVIENMAADVKRAASIVARIQGMATRKAPERVLLSLDDVIREALLFLRHEIESRAVAIAHHPDPAAPRLHGDRTQLQQVIVNLAINAMQAMTQAGSENRRIVISTVTLDTDTLCCSVEDSGPGIGAEHVGRLFESFFTTKESGMGMGLPICRSIVEAHGGRINADGKGASGGARFWFTLPISGSADLA